jgi:hypothetical protein
MQSVVVYEPSNTVGIDFTVTSSKTRRRNTCIPLVIDYFTKCMELFTFVNTKAKTIAQVFIDEVICRFDFPVRMISDNGFQLLSSFLPAYVKH